MQYLTSTQAAKRAGIDVRQLNRLVERGDLTPDAEGGSTAKPTRLYLPATIDALRDRLIADAEAKLARLREAAA